MSRQKEGMNEATKTYTAVIVEPRQHKALEFVLHNVLTNLSKQWNVVLMHGNKNAEYIDNIIRKLAEHKSRIQLINLNVDNLTMSEYNALLTSTSFYEKIPTETFLIFQTDSMICPNDNKLIDNYLNYDYVGAPWAHHNQEVGNGGFSLRKKSKALQKIKNCPYNGENEDLYFSSDKCEGLLKPDFDEAKLFSNESIYTNHSFGVHKVWNIFSPDDLKAKIKNCDGLNTLIQLNK
jgi:hypothetical protein